MFSPLEMDLGIEGGVAQWIGGKWDVCLIQLTTVNS